MHFIALKELCGDSIAMYRETGARRTLRRLPPCKNQGRGGSHGPHEHPLPPLASPAPVRSTPPDGFSAPALLPDILLPKQDPSHSATPGTAVPDTHLPL